MVASASRDQTVRVFDIRAIKEYCVLKGHKKEVCSVAWHPVHPLLVSGGSEGSILHWDLATLEPTFAQPSSPPRATLSQAHDSNVWSLAFHPLGHLLASASNDHTTRFWSRERPGDSSSVFSGGGEKPPDMSGQDDEDDAMVPGFSYGGGGGWWGKEEDGNGPSDNAGGPSGPGFDNNRRSGGYSEGASTDDFIPGFGATETPVASRQSGPLPSQEDMYTGPEDWSRPGGGGAGRGGGGSDPNGGRDEWGRDANRQGRWTGSQRRGGGGRY